jgi:Tfp pilus assembly protein PilN
MNAPNQLSFLPDDYLQRKARRRANVLCASLFGIVVVAIAITFSVTERNLREDEQINAEVNRQYTEAAKRIVQFQQIQEKQKRMAMQAELTNSLLERVPRTNLLADITNALPPGVSLLEMQLTSTPRRVVRSEPKTAFEQKRAASKKAEPRVEPKLFDVSVRVTGVAGTDVQVARLITELKRSNLLKDVNLLISDQFVFEGQPMRRFSIELLVDPDASVDLLDEIPSRTASIGQR